MQWTMNENSLFAILLRSSFVWSFMIAGATIAVMYAVLPEAYRIAAAVSGLPFIVIGCIAGWRQLQAPSAGRIARTVEALRAMSSGEFKDALAEGYRREGYEVRPSEGAVDLELGKEWRRTLVSCRRWKAGNTGIEPLRDLVKAKEAREAHECVCVVLGEVSGNARAFAQQHGVKIAGPAELARLITIPKGARKGALPQ
ncbi:MAG: restriction endonuclease [Burkholderiales bacterium]